MRSEERRGVFIFQKVDRTGSTSDDLKAYAKCVRVVAPRVLLAKEQTAGRGTRGRRWQSQEGALLFSVLLPLSSVRVQRSLIPLTVGLSICEALRLKGCGAGIKWPNDLWVNGGKAGGILCETLKDVSGEDMLLIGVGLNQVGRSETTTQGWPITGICSDGCSIEDMETLLDDLLVSLWKFLTTKTSDIGRRWPLFDAFYGKAITVVTEQEQISGVGAGINDEGHLLVLTSIGIKAIFSGTIKNDHLVN